MLLDHMLVRNKAMIMENDCLCSVTQMVYVLVILEKLKSKKVRKKFQLTLQNRLGILQHFTDVEEQWNKFKDAITTAAEVKIGRTRG